MCTVGVTINIKNLATKLPREPDSSKGVRQ